MRAASEVLAGAAVARGSAMMRAHAVLAVFALAAAACATPTSEPEPPPQEADLIGANATYTNRSPLSDAKVEAFRRAIEDVALGYRFPLTSGNVFAIQRESRPSASLDDRARERIAQEAYAFATSQPRGTNALAKLAAIGKTKAKLDDALDRLGLDASSTDAHTEAKRAQIFAALESAAKRADVTVLAAELHDDPGLEWQNALVLVDAKNQQIVIATGGFGN